MSVNTSCAPSAWQTAVSMPIPKSVPVSGPSDYRPISVTPIVSRVVKRIVIKNFIGPLILADVLGDQFGFKPNQQVAPQRN